MNILDETREEAYVNASDTQKYFYAHSDAGAALFELAVKYNLADPTLYKQYIFLVGDVILGFYRVEDIKSLLQEQLALDDSISHSLGSELQEYLAPLNDSSWQIPIPSEEANTIDNSITQVSTTLPEETSVSLPTFRTMTPVLPTEETVYTSTQAAILHEGKTAAAQTPGVVTPTSAQTQTGPRWETEN